MAITTSAKHFALSARTATVRAVSIAAAAAVVAGASTLLVLPAPASAGEAWIRGCLDLRRDVGATRSALRRYCACMNGTVEDDQPAGTSDLERAYPAAHRACSRKAGIQPGR